MNKLQQLMQMIKLFFKCLASRCFVPVSPLEAINGAKCEEINIDPSLLVLSSNGRPPIDSADN
jgi:hypothetical protein